MNPSVKIQKNENEDAMYFTLSGVNVSLANAIRRTILSDIPTVIFKTKPFEENRANILVNTSRFNNEILKQRLSCIPIHITDLEIPLEKYLVEVNRENLTDTIQYVTTEHFKIKNIQTEEYLSEKDTRNIFPPNEYTGYFLDFARLRPKISDEIPGEKLHFTCELMIGTAKEDASFNVASTCSYGYTPDEEAIEKELAKKRHGWKEDKDINVEFESKNWKMLEAKRIVKKDSFDFVIQTVGVFSNEALVFKAAGLLQSKLERWIQKLETDDVRIVESVNTMKNCWDVILENEDFTIGKVVEYMMYAKYFEEVKILSFCGFNKMHPHDADGILRVAYKEETDRSVVKQNLVSAITDAIQIFKTIGSVFGK
jgi:DNA-directed RNA polymerase alpha subunit